MKYVLKLVALFSLVGLSGVAAAETAGVTVSNYLSAEAGLSLFVAAFALLTFRRDYAHRQALRSRPVVLTPAAAAFTGRTAAYGIRRTGRTSRRAMQPTATL